MKAESVKQVVASAHKETAEFQNKSVQQKEQTSVAAEAVYNDTLRRNIDDLYRQEVIIQQATKPESKTLDVRAGVVPNVSEEEIGALAGWLEEVESTQVYQRIQNDKPEFLESPTITEAAETPTCDIPEFSNESPIHEEVGDDDLAVELVETQYDFSQEAGANTESLDDTTEMDSLINDIEASFETLEEEALGELLIGLFTTDLYREFQGEASELSLVDVSEIAEPLMGRAETGRGPFEKFTAYLELQEPEVRAQATEIIGSIAHTVNELKVAEGLTGDDKERLLIDLEQNIVELFTVLGIKLKAEQVHQFIELLLLTLDEGKPASKSYDIDYLNAIGTHEYKPLNETSMLGGLAQMAGNEPKSLGLIGKYTVKVCMI